MIGTSTQTDYEEIRARARQIKAREEAKLEAMLAQMPDYTAVGDPSQEQQRLSELADLYAEKWPWIVYAKGGSRAHKAIGLLLEGHVTHEAGDLYRVKGHRVNLKGKQCDCKDHVRFDKVDGKLCIHRLAVMLQQNWYGVRCQPLVTLIEQIDGYEYIDLWFERDYAYHGHGEVVRLVGYQLPRQKYPIRFMPHERVEVTLVQFKWAMDQTGYGMARLPEKIPNTFDYVYRIFRGEGLPIIKQSFHFRGRTDAMIQREKTRRITAIEWALMLGKLEALPVKVSFSPYEAKRIVEMRIAIDKHGIRAVDIEALPDHVVDMLYFYLAMKGTDEQYEH